MRGVTRLLLVGAAIAATGCGDDDVLGPTGATTVTVQFVYIASTASDPAVAQQFPQCVQGVVQTHIHLSWRSFAAVAMQAAGADRWEISFQDVPVGADQRIRVSDPNVCAQNSTGAATDGVTANGVTLTRIVDTPGSGTEPGLAFSVSANGAVTP